MLSQYYYYRLDPIFWFILIEAEKEKFLAFFKKSQSRVMHSISWGGGGGGGTKAMGGGNGGWFEGGNGG